MSLTILAYGLVLGGFLAGSAFLLDHSLRALGAQTRWIWASALSATAALPVLFTFWRPPQSVPDGGISLPTDMLAGAFAALPADTETGTSLLNALGGSFPLLWVAVSLTMAAVLAWGGWKLHLAARRFDRHELGGEEVLLSGGLGPAVLGFFRPIIVLPRWTLEMDRSKLELVVLHEREHVSARDPLMLAWGLFCTVAAPWNPWAWLLTRRLHLAVEADCDRRVLSRGIPPKRYGDLLLEVAEGSRSPSLVTPALAEGGTSVLERRLRMIRDAVRTRGIGAVILGALGGAALLFLACETPTPPAMDQAQESARRVVQEVAPAGVVEATSVPGLPDGEEGYFLVRKVGEAVEYVGPVSPGDMEFAQEGSDEGTVRFYFSGNEPLPVDEDAVSSGSAQAKFQLQEVISAEGGGTIKIRNEEADAPGPLYVVDGVIVSDPNFLETMDKATIDRIEVIKGAAAQAQYGERGANGVVLIFTKS